MGMVIRMKTQLIRLADNDQKARDLIRQNFEACAYNHTLSKKLWDRLVTASGPMMAIVPDWLDLNQLTEYKYTLLPPGGDVSYADGDRPTEHLVALVGEHLQTNNDAVVVCENLTANCKTYENWQWGPPPPVTCYGENEVYHILKPTDVGSEVIEDSIRQSQFQWGTGVCSSCKQVPEDDIPDEAFFDEIVRNTKQIFIPAFDGDGYLIWFPQGVATDNGEKTHDPRQPN